MMNNFDTDHICRGWDHKKIILITSNGCLNAVWYLRITTLWIMKVYSETIEYSIWKLCLLIVLC